MSALATRAVRALRHPPNWIQLAKFGLVGVSGYALNLAVYRLMIGVGAHTAAAVSFVVSAVSNYWWNRHWTFVEQKGHFGIQGMRYLVVTLVAFAVNQLWLLLFLDGLRWDKVLAQAAAVALIVPVNFLGNKLWSFR